MKRFPVYLQHEEVDCGPACLRMIAKHYGRHFKQSTLRDLTEIDREGVTLLSLSKAAEAIGLKTLGVRIDYDTLTSQDVPKPAIIHWKSMHYNVVVKTKSNAVSMADPLEGMVQLDRQDFEKGWLNDDTSGVALLLEPTQEFYHNENEEEFKVINFWRLTKRYLTDHAKIFRQVILGLLILSIIQLIQPFLMQFIVDIGIRNNDLNFIYLILLGQIMLYLGQYSIEFIRRWLLLYVGLKINLSLISDYLLKLFKLPMSFFDSKLYGDIFQRVEDHDRIESFLTSSLLDMLYAILSIAIFSLVLLVYNLKIFAIFFLGSSVYILYVISFQKRRKRLDYVRFNKLSIKQSNIFQTIHGIQDIKLSNTQTAKRWEWEKIQTNLFNTQIDTTKLEQVQQIGGSFITNLKDIIITVVAANYVINGELTLGGMLAIQFIIGQMNSPITSSLEFLQNYQDASLSAERINETYDVKDEYEPGRAKKIWDKNSDIILHNVSFRYSSNSNQVLKDINLRIPAGKVTAIVGPSGSGKTTLLKLILKFYEPTSGSCKIGSSDYTNIDNDSWRAKIGAVLQDGFIFTDSLLKNIVMDDTNIDLSRLTEVITLSNLSEVIANLSQGLYTKIGREGIKLSAGQEQRILIARALYKEPDFLFFDEATSALDTKNESEIVNNLKGVFSGKTILIIAHRLSTVKSADQIIVLDKGTVVESGTHESLVKMGSTYYGLVESQMTLDS